MEDPFQKVRTPHKVCSTSLSSHLVYKPGIGPPALPAHLETLTKSHPFLPFNRVNRCLLTYFYTTIFFICTGEQASQKERKALRPLLGYFASRNKKIKEEMAFFLPLTPLAQQ
ncbi:Uncharacterized protein Fot_56460 [Forsythia ovata]|uniref:Uncharacterized protein n=1 Tax=Forsythia ovata TaxID=205694 RepID=A0ABD1P086_9LAMI